MGRKSSKWSAQEDSMLKQLRESQIGKLSWENITNALNIKFKTTKTSKQCRERYQSCLRFQEGKIDVNWTKEQLLRLFQFYYMYGSSWSVISKFFQSKSEGMIKNKLNNSLKKTAKILSDREQKLLKNYKKYKGSITYKLLTKMLKLSNEVFKMALHLNCNLGFNCSILRFRFALLKLSLCEQNIMEEQLNEIIKLIKSINCRMKSFGHFREKNKKGWKLNQQNFQSICRLLIQSELEQNKKLKVEDNVKIQENYHQPFSYDQGVEALMEKIKIYPQENYIFCKIEPQNN